jgi:hypothetical protein
MYDHCSGTLVGVGSLSGLKPQRLISNSDSALNRSCVTDTTTLSLLLAARPCLSQVPIILKGEWKSEKTSPSDQCCGVGSWTKRFSRESWRCCRPRKKLVELGPILQHRIQAQSRSGYECAVLVPPYFIASMYLSLGVSR